MGDEQMQGGIPLELRAKPAEPRARIEDEQSSVAGSNLYAWRVAAKANRRLAGRGNRPAAPPDRYPERHVKRRPRSTARTGRSFRRTRCRMRRAVQLLPRSTAVRRRGRSSRACRGRVFAPRGRRPLPCAPPAVSAMNVAVASCDASSRAMIRARCFCGLPSISVNPSTALMQRHGCALTLSPPSVETPWNPLAANPGD